MEEKMAHQGIQRNSIETEKKNPLWTFEMLYNENTLFWILNIFVKISNHSIHLSLQQLDYSVRTIHSELSTVSFTKI